ncbi:BppU family phage baseplate upper protein [Lactococcus cremoris]|uniref:phage baseplate upper protein n=1 Tax=Lactococcus lactis subsp. cremoris TaxID=1359 RepID=UPI00287F9A5D|nr:BppU family phage baseplate upper protein [Lactococcus cremoris]WMB98843.1 BppU family phage baseplate upper protein [Lactococcus cremoris]
MSLDNFKKQTITWDMINQAFEQPIQIMEGDVNARTLLLKITDNGSVLDLTGYSVKLTYQYMYKSQSGFIMLTPNDISKGEFTLIIPTEMTVSGLIKSNLILLNEDKEQVIVSKNLTFISDDSTVTDLAQEVNNKIDDFTKLLLENMPQVMRSELNDLHAQTESNKSNIDLKANLADMTSLQSAMTDLKNEVESFGISHENLVTIKSLLDAIASNASESEVVELINSVKILTSNISLMSNGDYSPKANQTDLESLQHTVNNQSATVSIKANQTDLDNLQAKMNQAETDAKTAITKATEAQANSLPLNGNAVSASKLETARKLRVNLQSSAQQNFDGSSDVTNVGVSGVLPVVNGGTGTNDGVINTIAYSNSADGTYGFTTVYPNLNLLDGTKDFRGDWPNAGIWVNDGTYKGLTVKSYQGTWNGTFRKYIVPQDGLYTWSSFVKSESDTSNIFRVLFINNIQKPAVGLGRKFDWLRDSVTVSLKKGDEVIFNYGNSENNGGKISIAGYKLEPGSIATPYMQSASEVTINDYPKYVGFSNIIKPNKKSSDYKWLPMGLVSIDRATGSLKPAVIGIDYAQAHPVGSVVSNTSSSSSGYSTGKWENIGSAVIGSTTIYYWKRTA